MSKEQIMKMAEDKGISFEEMQRILDAKNDEGDEGNEGGDGEDEMFTQSELDRRISLAVEKNSKKVMQQMEERKKQEIEKARTEAEEYAKMSEREKQDADLKKRLEELEQREAMIQKQELKSQIAKDLEENGLPPTLADALIPLGDNEKIKEVIKDMRKSVEEQVNTSVGERLAGDTPPEGGGGITDDPFTKRIKKIRGK